LEVLRIVNEPRGIARLRSRQEVGREIAVYDLGGGTFDISVLRNRGRRFELKAHEWRHHLGGDELDNASWIGFQ